MNWKIAFFVAILALIASLFWNVNQLVSKQDSSGFLCQTDSLLQIPADTAESYIRSYANFLDSINISRKPGAEEETAGRGRSRIPALIGQLVDLQGFKLHQEELSSILAISGCDAEVWAMLCVKAPSKDFPGGEIDLLFEVRKPNADVHPPEDDDFFDFTEPCPSSCP